MRCGLILLLGLAGCTASKGDSAGHSITDSVDTACALDLPAATTVETPDSTAACGVSSMVDPWDVVTEWAVTTHGGSWVMPAVGEMTDDNGDGAVDASDTPDIAVTTLGDTLILLSGADGSTIWELDGYNSDAGTLIADVDDDGENEVVSMTKSGRITALDGEGSVKWTSEAFTFTTEDTPVPVVGDLDEDGRPEIVFDTAVVSGVDGSTVAELDPPDSAYRTPVVADLDQDGTEEIILGDKVYASDGSLLWMGPSSVRGEFSAVVDVDGDAGAEILFTTDDGASLYDSDGTELATYPSSSGEYAIPCAADLDGDGEVDFAIPGETQLTAIHADGTVLWQADTDDSSGLAGCSAFDFNADGAYDVVYADQHDVWLFDGATGEARWSSTEHGSLTYFEYPVVADVTGDGSADIVAVSNSGGIRGVTVYGQEKGTWPPAGPSWPAHDWAWDNVLEDGTVPATPVPSWSDVNLFRGRPVDEEVVGAPDLVLTLVGSCTSACPIGTFTLGFTVANQGLADVGAGVTVSLSVAAGTASVEVATATLPAIPAGTQLAGLSMDVPTSEVLGADDLVLSLGTTAGDGSALADCDLSNNEVVDTESICGD